MLEVFDYEQGSDEWFACRMSIPTASMFATVMAKGQGGAESKTRRKYMLQLIGERLTGEVAESYTNSHMERGKLMEAEARDMYAFMTDCKPVQVGFIRNDGKGCSPDSLVGNDGLLEIKTKLPWLQLEVLLSGNLPADHKAQVQGQIWVAEKEWCDFESYWPKLPPLIIREFRDEPYIKKLSDAVDQFNEEMHELEEQIKQRYL